MKGWLRASLCVLLAWAATAAQAAVQLSGARLADGGDRVQLILELSAQPRHASFYLDHPPRLVLDLPDTVSAAPVGDLGLASGDIRAVRSGIRDGKDLRVVIDLAGPLRAETYFAPAQGGRGSRLVVEFRRGTSRAVPPAAAPIDLVSVPRAEARPVLKATRPQASASRRQTVVVIDPGHGGKDTGAIGPNGTYEKHVVLAIARRVAALVDAEPGMRAVLTRRDDRFLPLRGRIEAARKHRADLFISIHADSAPNGASASGSSVYVLSTRGASSEAARWLADSENAADLVGGLRLADKDEKLASVLLDLSLDAQLESSFFLAGRILGELRKVGNVHKSDIERAGFVVLKAPDIPSVLVETAFLSNPDEERKLADPAHQRGLARAVMGGIRQYFRSRLPHHLMIAGAAAEPAPHALPTRAAAPAVSAADKPPIELLSTRRTDVAAPPPAPPPSVRPAPPAPKPATRTYVVRRGESLADVARRFGVPVAKLRASNALPDNQLRVPAGTRLTVPAG